MNAATFALWVFAGVLGVMVWRKHGGDSLRAAVRDAVKRGVEVVPRLVMVVLVAGFVIRLLPSGFVAEMIGPQSGFRGVLFAMLVGGFIPAGPSVFFSVIIILNEAGAGTVQLITLLTAWSVFAIHRVFIFEMPMMGPKFVLVRLVSSLPLPLVAAGITWLLVSIFPL